MKKSFFFLKIGLLLQELASKHTQAYLLVGLLASHFACFFEDKFSVHSRSNSLQHNIWSEKSCKRPVMMGEDFFHFSLVPNVFPLGYLKVLHGFPICSPSSQCVPKHLVHSTSLLSHMFWQMSCSIHVYSCTKGNNLLTSKQILLF
jgi:hypothetical protein